MSRSRKRILVAGCGFAGVAALRFLTRQRRPPFEIFAIDKQTCLYNYPILPRLLVESTLKDKVEIPYRHLFDHSALSFHHDRVQEVNAQTRCVRTDNTEIRYDHLILGFGSRALPLPQDSGVFVFYPKSLRHLEKLRMRVEDAVQQFAGATQSGRDTHRIAVVGGGLSGVEFAGALREAADQACRLNAVHREKIEISLYEARSTLGGIVADSSEQCLSEALRTALTAYGVVVNTDIRVERVAQEQLHTSKGQFAVDSVVSCIGSNPNFNFDLIGLEVAEQGIPVDHCLRHRTNSNVYAVGDGMLLHDRMGKPRLDLRKAHRASSQGKMAAKNVLRNLAACEPLPYRIGRSPTLAMINSRNGVFEFAGFSVSGRIAGLLKHWLEIRHAV